MLKVTAVVSLMFIAVVSVWASCDSCGSECAPACGTRRFRACCFNYLRKKRGPDTLKLYPLAQDVKDNQPMSKLPVFVVEEVPTPEEWLKVFTTENRPNSLEDLF